MRIEDTRNYGDPEGERPADLAPPCRMCGRRPRQEDQPLCESCGDWEEAEAESARGGEQ